MEKTEERKGIGPEEKDCWTSNLPNHIPTFKSSCLIQILTWNLKNWGAKDSVAELQKDKFKTHVVRQYILHVAMTYKMPAKHSNGALTVANHNLG